MCSIFVTIKRRGRESLVTFQTFLVLHAKCATCNVISYIWPHDNHTRNQEYAYVQKRTQQCMHAIVKMASAPASASASACCVCKTPISAGNRHFFTQWTQGG